MKKPRNIFLLAVQAAVVGVALVSIIADLLS